MNAPNKNADGLGDLNRNNIKAPISDPQMTEEEAVKMMNNFYTTVNNGMINLVHICASILKEQEEHTKILKSISEGIGEISIDTSDLVFYAKKTALKLDHVTEMEIEEHEKETTIPDPEDDKPDNAEGSDE